MIMTLDLTSATTLDEKNFYSDFGRQVLTLKVLAVNSEFDESFTCLLKILVNRIDSRKLYQLGVYFRGMFHYFFCYDHTGNFDFVGDGSVDEGERNQNQESKGWHYFMLFLSFMTYVG